MSSIGQILNYDMRKEGQGRGVLHAHNGVHAKDAPTLDKNTDEEVINFVDKYISCKIPDEETDKELYKLVTSRQKHHHTSTCKKKWYKVQISLSNACFRQNPNCTTR